MIFMVLLVLEKVHSRKPSLARGLRGRNLTQPRQTRPYRATPCPAIKDSFEEALS
jgi:hypothetical protein